MYRAPLTPEVVQDERLLQIPRLCDQWADDKMYFLECRKGRPENEKNIVHVFFSLRIYVDTYKKLEFN